MRFRRNGVNSTSDRAVSPARTRSRRARSASEMRLVSSVQMRRIALFGTALACGAMSPALAQAALVQTLNVSPTVSRGGEFKTVVQARTYDDQGGKPPPATTVLFRFQKGIVVHPEIAAVCTAETLRQTSGFGCSKDAQIGSGTAKVDLRPLATDLIDATVDVYNGPKPKVANGVATMVFWGRAKLSDNVTAGQALEATIVKDPIGNFEYRFDMQATVEPFQGIKVSVAEVKTTVGKLIVTKKKVKRKVRGKRRTVTVTKKRNWAEPPKTCDDGTWDFLGEIGYEDGQKFSKTVEVPCAALVGKR